VWVDWARDPRLAWFGGVQQFFQDELGWGYSPLYSTVARIHVLHVKKNKAGRKEKMTCLARGVTLLVVFLVAWGRGWRGWEGDPCWCCCCWSRWLLLKLLKSVLPLLRREGCCWKCKGVAGAGSWCSRWGGKEVWPMAEMEETPMLLLLAGACSRLLELVQEDEVLDLNAGEIVVLEKKKLLLEVQVWSSLVPIVLMRSCHPCWRTNTDL